jgi:hypothetical protein
VAGPYAVRGAGAAICLLRFGLAGRRCRSRSLVISFVDSANVPSQPANAVGVVAAKSAVILLSTLRYQ